MAGKRNISTCISTYMTRKSPTASYSGTTEPTPAAEQASRIWGMPRTARSAQACILCHKRKIKCDLGTGKQRCTNCEVGNHRCRPHERKRKHYSSSPSPQPAFRRGQARSDHQDAWPQGPRGIDPESRNDMWQPATPSVSGALYTRETPAGLAVSPRRQTRHSQALPSAQVSETYPLHTPSEKSYLGRSEYLGGNVPFNEGMTTDRVPDSTDGLSDIDIQVLHSYKAFELPPRATRESLIDKYMQLCSPWAPIVERSWLDAADGTQPSLLLLQAVFLAGSRVTSNVLQHASSQDFYQRARALFFSGHEKNIMFSIVALCLLQWWNRSGPEKISTDTSGFWVRIAVGMAYQAGLHKEPPPSLRKGDRMMRRRLWWTLVSRDSIISVGLGRPRTINLEDSDVAPPSVEDFANPDAKARLFVNYVSICQLLGDVAQCFRRKWKTSPWRQDLENALYRWIRELPDEFRVFRKGRQVSAHACYFEARQLHVPYFVTLVILHRGPVAGSAPSEVSLIASAYIASIYEEFLARDELRHLGPAFTFYALAAGLSQLSGYRYASLADAAEDNFKVIRLSLEVLSERWGSANGALRALHEARKAVLRLPQYREPPACVPSAYLSFFGDVDPGLCNMGHLIDGRARQVSGPVVDSVGDVAAVVPVAQPGDQAEVHLDSVEDAGQNAALTSAAPEFLSYMDGEYGQQGLESLWGTANTIGSWLLDDFGYQGLT